jgi:hypothetical protein
MDIVFFSTVGDHLRTVSRPIGDWMYQGTVVAQAKKPAGNVPHRIRFRLNGKDDNPYTLTEGKTG